MKPSSRLRLPLVRLCRDGTTFEVFDEYASLVSRAELFAALQSKQVKQLEVQPMARAMPRASCSLPTFRRLDKNAESGARARWQLPCARIARPSAEEVLVAEEKDSEDAEEGEGVGAGFSAQHLRNIYESDDEGAGVATTDTPMPLRGGVGHSTPEAERPTPPLQTLPPRAKRGSGKQLDFIMLF